MSFNTTDSYLRGSSDGYKGWLNKALLCQFSLSERDNWCVLSFSIAAIISSATSVKSRRLFSTQFACGYRSNSHHPLLFLRTSYCLKHYQNFPKCPSDRNACWFTVLNQQRCFCAEQQLSSSVGIISVMRRQRVRGKGHLKWTAGEAKLGPTLIAVNFYLTQFVFKRQLISLPKPLAFSLVPL